MRRRKKTAGYADANPPYTTGLDRKALAPRSTRERHESASNQPELILKLPSAAPDLGDTADFLFDWHRGSGNEAKRHVAGIGVAVCDRRNPLGHRRHILASGHGRDDGAGNRGGGATTRRRGEREAGRAGGSCCDAR